jgi:hypothetical protein
LGNRERGAAVGPTMLIQLHSSASRPLSTPVSQPSTTAITSGTLAIVTSFESPPDSIVKRTGVRSGKGGWLAHAGSVWVQAWLWRYALFDFGLSGRQKLFTYRSHTFTFPDLRMVDDRRVVRGEENQACRKREEEAGPLPLPPFFVKLLSPQPRLPHPGRPGAGDIPTLGAERGGWVSPMPR